MPLEKLKDLLIFIGLTEDNAKRQLAVLSILAQRKISMSKDMTAGLIEESTIRDYFDNVSSELSFSKKELVKKRLNSILTT